MTTHVSAFESAVAHERVGLGATHEDEVTDLLLEARDFVQMAWWGSSSGSDQRVAADLAARIDVAFTQMAELELDPRLS